MNNIAYFYFPNNGALEDLVLTFTKPKEIQATILVSFQDNDDYELPQDLTDGFLFTQGQASTTYTLPQNVIDGNTDKTRIIIAATASQRVSEIQTEASYKETQNATTIIIIIVFISVLGSFIASITICTFVIRRRSRQARESSARELSVQKKIEVLSPKDIEKYFPKKEFSSINNPLNNILCSICLEDFQPKSTCRQLYCQHIHHSACVDAWLNSRNACPDCRKSMTLNTIKEFIEKNKKESQPTDDRQSIP